MRRFLCRIPYFSLAVLFALGCLASDITDRRPPWDAIKLVSFNRGDAADRSWLAQSPSNVGSGLTYSGGVATGTEANYITYPDNADLDVTGDFALCLWVKFTAADTGYNTVVYKGGATERNIALIASWSASVPTLYAQYYNAGFISASDGSSLSLNTWYHIAATRVSGALKYYRDGVEISSTTSAVLPIGNVNALTIGGFAGMCDDVRIYKSGKTANEIAAIYAEGLGVSRP